jgi:hypothetical protein
MEMISKEAFIESALKEVNILKHLFTKITPGSLDYRPTEKQRSTKELLQYLSHGPALILKGIGRGKIDDIKTMAEETSKINPDDFPQHMDTLAGLIRSTIGPMTEKDFAEEIDLFGRGMAQSKALWLMEVVLKNLVGYKMQLFLYIKASGNLTVVTSNLWHGRDE